MTRQEIINDYVKLERNYFIETGKANIPRDIYRKRTSISESDVRKYFGGLTELREAAQRILCFKARNQSEIRRIGKSKRYIISSAVEGAPINRDFFDALKLYARKNKAELVLIWTRGVKASARFPLETIAELEPYLVTEMVLNENLLLKDFLIHPSQGNPLAGLDRFGNKETSLIVGSTKLMLNSIPRPKGQIPHLLWSTGTISEPSYAFNRTGEMAKQDNCFAALVIEIESKKKYYIRPVEWINDCFVDLGKAYYKNKVIDIKSEAMILGDLHLGEENTLAVNVSLQQINYFKPKKVFLHDIISFNSISHHNFNKYLTKALIPSKINTLEKELNYAKEILSDICKKISSTIYVVHSNHDDFLYKYLDTGEYTKDTPNSKLAGKFYVYMMDKMNPVKEYLNMSRLNFLTEGESFKVENIECGTHGSYGNNGARGNPNSFRKSNNKIILGHSHQPKILGDTWYVGTLSELSLSYTKGNSSWLHANAVIYANGGRQLIIWIDNKWKL